MTSISRPFPSRDGRPESLRNDRVRKIIGVLARPALAAQATFLLVVSWFIDGWHVHHASDLGWASLGVLALVAAGGAVLAQSRSATALKQVARVVNDIAAGNMTVRAKGDADLEVGVNAIAAKFNTTLLLIRDASRRVEEGWRAVEDISHVMSDNAETTAARASDAASAAEAVARASQTVAVSCQQLVDSFVDVATHASQAAQMASGAAQNVSHTKTTTANLVDATGRAGDVLSLISKVARQTHLLALNARIEAARESHEGAGFNVIANEVKHLASVTATASTDVTETVSSISSGASEVAAGMRLLDETIVVVSSSQAAIAAAVEEQTMTTRSIGDSMAHVAERSAVIAKTIAEFAKAGSQTAYAGTRARAAAGAISDASTRLLSIVDDFVVDEVAGLDLDRQADAAVAWRDGSTTIVPSNAFGDGLEQFCYTGRWSHDAGSLATDANSYSCLVDDSATLRFSGTSVEVFGIADAHHGILSASVDQEPAQLRDTYSAQRNVGASLFRRDGLAQGAHQLTIRVTGERHASSRFHWVAITKAIVS